MISLGSVYLIYGPGPERLTKEEADRVAIRCFNAHNHLATEPQQAIYWVRARKDYRA